MTTANFNSMKRLSFLLPVLGFGLLILGKSSILHAVGINITVDFSNVTIIRTASFTIDMVPLTGNRFYGKHLVIPFTVRGSLKGTPRVNVIFTNSRTYRQWASLAVPTVQTPFDRNRRLGAMRVPRSSLGYTYGSSGYTIQYYLQATDGFSTATVGSTDKPFAITIVDSLRVPLTTDDTKVVIPDLDGTDGKTTVHFPAGSLSAPGALVVRQLNPSAEQPDSRNALPTAVYSFELEGTQIQAPFDLTLTYPANLDGTIGDDNAEPKNAYMAFWDNAAGLWVPLPSEMDTTLHTLKVTMPHLSKYALFTSGPLSAADFRPKQRILTPNGDGINDTISFTGVTASDEVRIFDVRGRRVRTMAGPSPVWDGRDDEGKIVESGVYIYQYPSQGSRVSGVVVVAK